MSRTKLFAFAVAGLAVAWLMFATPTTSQAQGFSLSIGGPAGYFGLRTGYNPGFGYGGYPVVGYPYGYGTGYGYGNYGYGGYSNYRSYGSTFGYGGYRQPVIVHPEVTHWTPYRGWHQHGQIHVPQRGYYRTFPY